MESRTIHGQDAQASDVRPAHPDRQRWHRLLRTENVEVESTFLYLIPGVSFERREPVRVWHQSENGTRRVSLVRTFHVGTYTMFVRDDETRLVGTFWTRTRLSV